MQTLTETLLEAGWNDRVVSSAQIARLLQGSPQSRYNLVNRALSRGELVRLRRGLYVLSAKHSTKVLHPFVLAQALVPGSYISFESALSHHGWLPESVPLILSVTSNRRTLEVENALGTFRFSPLVTSPGHFLEAVERLVIDGRVAFVARPLRALLDLISQRKIEPGDAGAFVDGMRIDAASIAEVPAITWRDVGRAYTLRRTLRCFEALTQEYRR
ncbi:MAG: hypothetical protein AUK47_13420 [Deltaproteobacteria bacterium CG2_30_63_29]|nr:MAG: hypothetical protein AUK47_13420 [Deltaproteobacteria bacterium CG2_30_63_29]PJB36862.1 MAG: hypothetical protein CO108_22275 [Deltaproteobacteria bacterium CG_4_9_14_3_um_filter_63_12]